MTTTWKRMAAFTAAALIASCGGGGDGGNGGADYMTIAIDGGAPTTYAETQNLDTPLDYDPYVWSIYDEIDGTVNLYTHAGWNGNTYPVILEIQVDGNVAMPYDVADGSSIYYTAPGGTVYVATWSFPSTGGTIDVTRFDAEAGGRVEGTFDVTADVGGDLVNLAGSFRVTRW